MVRVSHNSGVPHLEINCPRPLRPQKSSDFGSAGLHPKHRSDFRELHPSRCLDLTFDGHLNSAMVNEDKWTVNVGVSLWMHVWICWYSN